MSTTTGTTSKAAAPTLAASPKHPRVKLVARPSTDRGNANHGWLKSFHTFNFASYYERGFDSFGALRVVNYIQALYCKTLDPYRLEIGR